MNATLDRPALLDALARVAGAVAGRTTRPVLAGVLVRADGDRVTLTATDTELTIVVRLPPGDVPARAGAAVVSHAKLVQIMREADAPAVRLTTGDNHGVTVRCGGRWELPGYDPAEFPEPAAFPGDGEVYHEADAGTLRAMIRRTAFAADKKDSTRFALSGVLWERNGKALRLVATDSKRLAVAEGLTAAANGDDPKGTHLVPPQAVQLLTANLGGDGEAVRVVLRPNDAMFRTERAVIHTALISGRYPPWETIIGQSRKAATTSITLPTGAFLSAVRQAAVMVDDESKRVDMAFADGAVTMQARGADTGSSEVPLALPEYAGGPVTIAFDPHYLTEFLKVVDGPTVTLKVADGTKPAIFDAGDGWTFLVMPLAG